MLSKYMKTASFSRCCVLSFFSSSFGSSTVVDKEEGACPVLLLPRRGDRCGTTENRILIEFVNRAAIDHGSRKMT
jgi:hypothetical protein